jgi:hypothetical protein
MPYWFLMLHQLKSVAMNIEPKGVGGFLGVFCLALLLEALILPLQAGDSASHLINREVVLSGGVPRGVPQIGRPPYAPPVFMDRGTPMSERPFAKPFVDRSSPMAERPLPPIGGGGQVAPGSRPLIWCQGKWLRADSLGHHCSSR